MVSTASARDRQLVRAHKRGRMWRSREEGVGWVGDRVNGAGLSGRRQASPARLPLSDKGEKEKEGKEGSFDVARTHDR